MVNTSRRFSSSRDERISPSTNLGNFTPPKFPQLSFADCACLRALQSFTKGEPLQYVYHTPACYCNYMSVPFLSTCCAAVHTFHSFGWWVTTDHSRPCEPGSIKRSLPRR